MTRNLNAELRQCFQSMGNDVYGIEMFNFISNLIVNKSTVNALWNALSVLIQLFPYQLVQKALVTNRHQLMHGTPEQVQAICSTVLNNPRDIVRVSLFLVEYMKVNATRDLARFAKWERYSEYYQISARDGMNQIKNDHFYSIFLENPIATIGHQKASVLRVALQQHNSTFLNNERLNSIINHFWQSESPLDPNQSILSLPFSSSYAFHSLLDQPFRFYLTPMGFDAIIKILHIFYVLLIYYFLAKRRYLYDEYDVFECILWTFSWGYILYEPIECYTKGYHTYFSLAGWINYWDIFISIIWIILFGFRLFAISENYYRFWKDEDDGTFNSPSPTMNPDLFEGRWNISQAYVTLWALQVASLSVRSLALFQTSRYFGVMLRIILHLFTVLVKFLAILLVLLIGFTFGLYYIQGGYDDAESADNTFEWYIAFKYLFQLTVGAGDFSEIGDIVDEVTAQIFTMIYIVFGTILMINLLIALMTTAFEDIHKQAVKESVFAKVETTYDLSNRSRFMPAPLCIYVLLFALLIHIINFIPALLCPISCNIYNCINHYQYKGLVQWR
eukprot:363427_1